MNGCPFCIRLLVVDKLNDILAMPEKDRGVWVCHECRRQIYPEVKEARCPRRAKLTHK